MNILNNVTTQNDYTPANEVGGGIGVILEAFIYNQPVFLQIQESSTGQSGEAVWSRHIYLPPQQIVFYRTGIFGARVRSAVENEAAQVTLVIVSEKEHPITAALADIRSYLGGR